MHSRILDLPKIIDSRGKLSFVEEDTNLPFRIRRVYWIYDVPAGEYRGGHAFKETDEFIVALSGSFDIELHDGFKELTFHLNRSYYGVLIPKMTWRTLRNFSTNSLAMVISSGDYKEEDYIREFKEFMMRRIR